MNHYHLLLKSIDPWLNLALEELIFTKMRRDSVIFMLYQNSNSVIIGKNQNPWTETDPFFLSQSKIPLIRRISGGGTVWHDLGNINYCFIYEKDTRTLSENHIFLIDSLKNFGIELSRNDRGDLLFEGSKCSGNAIAHREGKTLHHGTLLINSDLQLLKTALKPIALPDLELVFRGIPSVRVPVTQLGPRLGMTPGDIIEKICQDWTDKFKSEKFNIDLFLSENEGEIEKISQRLSSWDWLYGRTPEFILNLKGENFTVQDGFVEKTVMIDQWFRLQKYGSL